jgi:hypothetical protein
VETTPILYIPKGERFRTLTPRSVLAAGVDGVVSMVKGAPHVAFRVRPMG